MGRFEGYCANCGCNDRGYLRHEHVCTNCGETFCEECYNDLLDECDQCYEKICCNVCYTITDDCICESCIKDEDMDCCIYCRGYFADDARVIENKCRKCRTTQSYFDLLPNELIEMIFSLA